MQFENLKEAIDFAIEKEIKAAAFYEKASEEESMSGSKELFKEFAAEERKHEQKLKNLDTADLESFEQKKVPDLKRSDYIVEFAYEPGMDFRDIVTYAMKEEEKALKLYNELEKRADTEAGVKLFQFLSQEEAQHKLQLETMLDDYMAKMGD